MSPSFQRTFGARSHRAMGLLTPLLFCVIATSCGDSDSVEERIQIAKLSEGCLINSDCEEPLVCAFRRCHQQCENTRDCPTGERCVAADRPFSVCQLSDERDCTYNSDCPYGQLCGVDAQCRDQCQGDRDCIEEQVCVGGTCADESELTAEGTLDPADDVEVGTGSPCLYNSECPDPLACVQGQCRLECVEDRDCFPTFVCSDSRCTPAGAGAANGG